MSCVRKLADGNYYLCTRKNNNSVKSIFLGKHYNHLGPFGVPEELLGKRFKVKIEIVEEGK